jgi:hypothetical protein
MISEKVSSSIFDGLMENFFNQNANILEFALISTVQFIF